MKIFKRKSDLVSQIKWPRSISFIPTMGSIHPGHVSLIKKAKKNKRRVLVSLYVNPKQFNSKKDYQIYPRNFKKDLNILKKYKVDYAYIPNNKDIYSFKPQKSIFKHSIIKELCGKFRKGHFDGVLNVVNRLLEIVRPKYIYLGKKDLQQLYLIKEHIKKMRIQTKVVPCKTIRLKNGVAYSSRNINLEKKEINITSNVYKYLINIKKKLKRKRNFKFNQKSISKELIKLGVKKIDYCKCLNNKNLKKIKNYKIDFNIFIAYYIGKIRLIDNI